MNIVESFVLALKNRMLGNPFPPYVSPSFISESDLIVNYDYLITVWFLKCDGHAIMVSHQIEPSSIGFDSESDSRRAIISTLYYGSELDTSSTYKKLKIYAIKNNRISPPETSAVFLEILARQFEIEFDKSFKK